MRHFSHLGEDELARFFLRLPEEFDATSGVAVLSTSLGATLYMPATRPHLADDLRRQFASGVRSAVICLEDSISDSEVPAAERHLVTQLALLGPEDAVPVVFVRVREVDQVDRIGRALAELRFGFSGFVLPKFGAANGAEYLAAVERVRGYGRSGPASAGHARGRALWAMPVIETPQVLHLETRHQELSAIRDLLNAHRDRVLAVRVGATDLAGVIGIRRPRELTVHDVPLVASVLADIMNHLGRQDGTGFTISGPVWEHFADHDRLFRPQLRQSPFQSPEATSLRARMIRHNADELLREIALDKASGFTGKTVIHPSHVLPVHALSTVSAEEWADATDLLGENLAAGGVRASSYRNKMNEAKPHQAWARRTLLRASAFGVLREGIAPVDLMIDGAR